MEQLFLPTLLFTKTYTFPQTIRAIMLLSCTEQESNQRNRLKGRYENAPLWPASFGSFLAGQEKNISALPGYQKV